MKRNEIEDYFGDDDTIDKLLQLKVCTACDNRCGECDKCKCNCDNCSHRKSHSYKNRKINVNHKYFEDETNNEFGNIELILSKNLGKVKLDIENSQHVNKETSPVIETKLAEDRNVSNKLAENRNVSKLAENRNTNFLNEDDFDSNFDDNSIYDSSMYSKSAYENSIVASTYDGSDIVECPKVVIKDNSNMSILKVTMPEEKIVKLNKKSSSVKPPKVYKVTYGPKQEHRLRDHITGEYAIYINGKCGATMHLHKNRTYCFDISFNGKDDTYAGLIFTEMQNGGRNVFPTTPTKNGKVYFEITDKVPSMFYYGDANVPHIGGVIMEGKK